MLNARPTLDGFDGVTAMYGVLTAFGYLFAGLCALAYTIPGLSASGRAALVVFAVASVAFGTACARVLRND